MIALPASLPKAPGYVDRSEPIERIEALVPELRARYGITRVGETTGLDRTGIPTYCAIAPNSPDLIAVYNGKGSSRRAARISAIMEAVERQAATAPRVPTFSLSLAEVRRHIDLSPLELIASDEAMVECTNATDLLSGRQTPLPMALVQFPWPRETRITARVSTNGLASGNNVVEALYHALLEMIERHVWSLYVVRSEILPRYYRGEAASDRMIARILSFPTGDPVLDALHDEIAGAGLKLRVCILDEAPLPCVALVSVIEERSHPPMAHLGMGCSLRPAHAIERAMTEAIQSRVVDMQAAREDIRPADDESRVTQHAKRIDRLPEGRWFADLPGRAVCLDDLPDPMTPDLALDVAQVLERMQRAGIRQIAALDIAAHEHISVVRICAPDCETTAVDGRLGPIALAQLNPLAS